MLEGVALFGPVMVEVEGDLAVFFSLFSFDADGKALPEALEYLRDRDAVFLGQGLSQREFEDILDSCQLFPVVCKPITVLYTTIDTAVQANNLVCIQVDP